MLRRASVCVLLAALSGCVSPSIPEGYTGPVATVRDTVRQDSGTRATFFYLAEIDGRPIETSLGSTRAANYGRGFSMRAIAIQRQIPARQVTVKLEGRTAYGAPILELVNAGSMYSVTEVIEFEPQPDGYYVVRGELTEDSKAVWLQDLATGERVGRTVESR